MKCKITLDNGKAGVFSATGDLTFGEGGFCLFYGLDGDKCLLTCSEDGLVQERRGSVPMKMTFVRGKETDCTLGSGGLSGSFTVFTDRIDVKTDERSVNVKLVYNCAGESVTLAISAEAF